MNQTSSENHSFEWFLLAAAMVTVLVGSYESLAQQNFREYSILSFTHSYGYLKNYPVIYSPGKGIWRLIAWIGSGMMVVMMLYSVRKRLTILRDFGSLRHWLSAHMFLGTIGPILVMFHTTFKFGGIIATSFWCMIVTMLFGILGRYIYIQIPRSLAGAELKVNEMDLILKSIDEKLARYSIDANIKNLIDSVEVKAEEGGVLHLLLTMMRTDMANLLKIAMINRLLKRNNRLTRGTRGNIVRLASKKAALLRKKNFLSSAHKLLHYWHVVHVPLAIVMFIIMFLHIIVYYLFRPATGGVL